MWLWRHLRGSSRRDGCHTKDFDGDAGLGIVQMAAPFADGAIAANVSGLSDMVTNMTFPMLPRRRRRIRVLPVIGACTIAVLVIAGVTAWLVIRPAGRDAEGVVTSDGVRLSLSGGTVTAGSDVAEAGAVVQASMVRPTLPDEVSSFARPIADGIEVTIEGNQQPRSAVTISFRLPDDVEGTPVALSQSSNDVGVEISPSTWNPDTNTLIVQADHLSWRLPVLLDFTKLGAQMTTWMQEYLNFGSVQPSCTEASPVTYQNASLAVRGLDDPVVWPCLSSDGESLQLTLQSNSPLSWVVTGRPAFTASSLTGSGIYGRALAAAAGAAYSGDSAAVVPGSTATLIFADGLPSIIHLRANAALTQAGALLWGASMLLPKPLALTAGGAECVAGFVESPPDSSDGAAMSRTLTDCILTGLDSAVSGVVSILLTGPAMLATDLEGIQRELSGNANVDIVIDRTSTGDGPYTTTVDAPPGSTWYYLSGIDWVSAQRGDQLLNTYNAARVGPYSVDGVTYEHSVRYELDHSSGVQKSLAWNTLRACSTLDVTVGMEDSAERTAAVFTVQLDDQPVQEFGPVPTGTGRHLALDLTGVYRVTLGAYIPVPINSIYAQPVVWADPKIACDTATMDEYLNTTSF